jgi:hypothetical protein
VILVDAIVQVLALKDAGRHQLASGAIRQSMVGITRDNCLSIGLAPVDNDTIWSAMTLERLPEETPGGRQIPMLAETEFDRVTVEICPSSASLDVDFIEMPFSGDGTDAPVEAVQQRG